MEIAAQDRWHQADGDLQGKGLSQNLGRGWVLIAVCRRGDPAFFRGQTRRTHTPARVVD